MRIFRQKRWLLLPGLLVLGAALLLYARFVEPARLTVRTRTVQAEGLSRSLKVVFLTDTHFGRWYDVDRAARLVDAINARQPDVVLFGGDLLDNYARDRDSLDLEELAAQLGRIQAPGGKFAVWGNHDYGGGAVRVYESLLEEWNVQVVGYDDVLMGWTDPELYQLNRDIFQLVVAHEPSVAEKISAPGECFVLSGHTHGGAGVAAAFEPALAARRIRGDGAGRLHHTRRHAGLCQQRRGPDKIAAALFVPAGDRVRHL